MPATAHGGAFAKEPAAVILDQELRFVGSNLRVPERLVRLSIATLVPFFGITAALMLFADEGPKTLASQIVLAVVSLSTVPVAIVISRANLTPIYWSREPRAWGINHLFVLYGDVAVSTVQFTFSNPETGLFGTLLFATLSAYVAHFCSPAARNAHIVFTTAVILIISVNMWRTGDYTVASVMARCLVAIAVVNGTVLLQSMFAAGVRHAIRSTLLHAHQDALTSLWNRRGFTYWATATVKRSEGSAALVIVDIDDFKSINDTRGHRQGDDVLQLAARRLEDAVGTRGVLARTGGDEFAIATELEAPGLIELAEAVRDGIYRVDDEFPVTASVGVAIGTSAETTTRTTDAAEQLISNLLHAADTALYEAKAAGRNRVAYVDLNDGDPRPRVLDQA